jgi:hypothetical protein
MDIIVPPSKNNGKGKAAWIALAAVLALAAAFAAGAFFFRDRNEELLPAPQTKLETIEIEIQRLLGSMDQAEELANRPMYLEIAKKAAAKNIEADDEWEKITATTQGLRYGLQHGIFEEYIHRFTDKDKYEMLAAERGLTVEELRLFKSEIEMVFFDDYAEKFGHSHEVLAPPEIPVPAES